MKTALIIVGVFAFLPLISYAKTVRYDLSVTQEKINLSGKKEVDFALMVNGGIPAPTLEFTEGDDAEITVTNNIPTGEEVSMHWHGLLLPPEEDGVAYVNTPPIFKGKSRTFRFKIRQHGTYWYHSHTALQEQKGVFGAFIIHPKKKTIKYDKDIVVVMSDWSDENADQILKNLKKDGDFYLYKKDSIRSIFGALKEKKFGNYFENEWSRMGGMDLSDVGYDAFLINGKKDSQLATIHPGDTVRIRIINASASSYFYVSLGNETMKVISADGVDIEPVNAKEILFGMAETYDILFTPKEHKNYELRATVQDVTGFASGWLGMGEKVPAPNKPLPDFYATMNHSNHDMATMNHADHSAHTATTSSVSAHEQHSSSSPKETDQHHQHSPAPIDHSKMNHATAHEGHQTNADKPTAGPVIETLTVDELKAQSSTKFENKNIKDVKLVLDGDMERYVWHINGKTIQEDTLVEINEGDVVRFTFENKSMMHHPMHLHGHFFRVLNKNGDKSPLKHTVDVPPHQNRTIEFYANEPGQWMLHCHNLFHMKTGMARVVKYSSWNPKPENAHLQKQDPHLHEHIYNYSMLELASNHAEANVKLMRTWDEIDLNFEASNQESKHFSFKEPWENEGHLLYRRWMDKYLNFSIGANLYDEKGYGVVGVGYILPLLIDMNAFVSHEGKFRLDLEKRFQWTQFIYTDVDFTWRPEWENEHTEVEVSLMYSPSWYWSAGLMMTEKNVGVGAQVQF